MKSKDFIYVGGVPGAGKTTLCETLSSLENIFHIRSGEIKRPESIRRYDIALSQLNQEKSLEINRWFFNNLFTKTDSGIYLVDTHYTYPVDSNFVNLCPEDITENIGLYILVETNPEDIINRRISRGRDGDSLDFEFTKLEIEKERQEALRLYSKFKIPLIVLRNEGNLKSSLLDFQNFLRV